MVSVTLELNIHGSELSVTITNLSDQEQRLWDWHNSWGWWALSIQVRDQADKQSEISHKSRDWTKNGPDHFAIFGRAFIKIDHGQEIGLHARGIPGPDIKVARRIIRIKLGEPGNAL